MITLEDLDKARMLRKTINECKSTLESIRSAAGVKSPVLDGLPHNSEPSDHVGNMAAIITDLENSIQEYEKEFRTAWAACAPFVMNLRDPIVRTCFYLRFHDALSHKEIAACLGRFVTEASVRGRIYREIGKQKRE